MTDVVSRLMSEIVPVYLTNASIWGLSMMTLDGGGLKARSHYSAETWSPMPDLSSSAKKREKCGSNRSDEHLPTSDGVHHRILANSPESQVIAVLHKPDQFGNTNILSIVKIGGTYKVMDVGSSP